MYEWIKTDNDFANSQYRDRLVNDPVLASLVDLLMAKGAINQVEFAKYVNDRCQAVVSATEKVTREDE